MQINAQVMHETLKTSDIKLAKDYDVSHNLPSKTSDLWVQSV